MIIVNSYLNYDNCCIAQSHLTFWITFS